MDKITIKGKIIKNITGRAVPKPENDQNTDDIVPARYLKEITFRNMGEYVYYDERFKNGNPIKEHPFNNEKYQGSAILIAGANYGCGSSREHAPQALYRYGIRAIIAESFAEIFAGNCASLGIVGITIPAKEIKKLADYVKKNPSVEFNIDLENKVINYNKRTVEFDMPEGRRQSFLNGTWDAMAILQKNERDVEEIVKRLDYLKF